MTAVSVTAQSRSALAGIPCGTWQIDPAHSVVGFAVRHLMSKVRGRFDEFEGQLTIDEEPQRSTAHVEIALASVDTGNAMRDNHLRSADFFDVEHYPTMTFTSTGLRELDDAWVLDGELTIRDVTRKVHIELELLGFDPTGMQGEQRIGFEGRTSINRSDYGVSFGLSDSGKIVVADRVDILLEIEAVLAA